MTHGKRVLLLAAVAASLAGCTSGDPPPPSPAPPPSAIAAATAPPAEPLPAPAPVHGATEPVTGTVAETMEAASYTYVRLTTPQGEQWAAIPQAKLAVGDTVTILDPMVIDGFQSPTLKRHFDHILFGTLGSQAPQAPAGNPHAGLFPAAIASANAASVAPVPRATGPNAHTIAEILGARASLKDKPVTVRGRVTKLNASILGRNWLHLADGSGKKAEEGTIVVTAAAAAATVGDVVVVRGVLRTDKDFGAGYSYAALIEDASVAPK